MPSLKVTLTRSPIGFEESQKRTVRALGLTRINKTVVRPDNPQVRGMVNAVRHLVKFEVVDGECERRNRSEQRKHKG